MNSPQLTIDPEVMLGKPVIAGTRITVELILEELAAGMTTAQLVSSYPRLTPEAVSAALAYASKAVQNDVQRHMTRQSA